MTVRTKDTLQHAVPYKQGQSRIDGIDQVIKLSSNELPFPPSPRAIEAFHAVAGELTRYPDGAQGALRAALAARHGIDAKNIFAGNGSEEAIGLILRTLLSSGDEMVVSANSFIMAGIYARSVGAEIVRAPEISHRVDVEALLAAVTARTRVVYFCSPNNPTGTYSTRVEVAHLLRNLPSDILVLLDGAYAEFVDADDYEDGFAHFSPAGRLALTRTFSKAYGLAALRIGWAAVPDSVADAVARLRTPFNVNSAALAAARAALADQEYLRSCVARVNAIRDRFTGDLQSLGLCVVPGKANFVLIDFSGTLQDPADLDQALQKAGILGRPAGGQAREFRISIGTEEEMARTFKVIRDWVQRAP